MFYRVLTILLTNSILLMGQNSFAIECNDIFFHAGIEENTLLDYGAEKALLYKKEGFNFPKETTVYDLSHGNEIILFRLLRGEYKKGYNEGYTKEEKGYSYSLDPTQAFTWNPAWVDMNQDRDIIVISKQNVVNDQLRFPSENKDLPGHAVFVPLTQSTKLSEIMYFYEIKVPIERDHPIGFISKDEFKKIYYEYLPSTYNIQDLLNKIIKSPHFKKLSEH